VQDFRRILDDPEVDAIAIATPDHWHALATVMACQAGKDVYVEKPTSHSIWESRKMVEAARKHERVVQVGTQNRSAPYCYEAAEYARSREFGDIRFVRVMNSKQREPIGRPADSTPPDGVDYDLWLGPAPLRPFNENRFHYNWHWFWDYGGGDLSNDGVHQIDLARWLTGRALPSAVSASGARLFFDDARETPDTQTVTWEFDGLTMVLEQTLGTPYLKKVPLEFRDSGVIPNWPFDGTRVEIYGTKQFMCLGRREAGTVRPRQRGPHRQLRRLHPLAQAAQRGHRGRAPLDPPRPLRQHRGPRGPATAHRRGYGRVPGRPGGQRARQARVPSPLGGP
jgi:predicted dehydrogenase